jgi:hypothetical protein
MPRKGRNLAVFWAADVLRTEEQKVKPYESFTEFRPAERGFPSNLMDTGTFD